MVCEEFGWAWACHQARYSFILAGSRFEPLTQLDTQEDVRTIVVDAVDEVNQAIEEDEVDVRFTVAQSDTETVPSAGGYMQHPVLGEVAAGFEEILAAFTSLDAVDLTEIFSQASSCVEIPVRFLERSFQVLHEVGTAGSRVRSGRNTTRSGVSVRNCSFSSHDRCCFVLLRFHRFGWTVVAVVASK